ncbi:MAG: LysR family transcriptional regulator, partial [Pseudomonas sp.]
SRTITYTTPNYLQAAHIVASSELAAVLPSQLARHFAALLPLTLWELPMPLGPFHLEVVHLAQRLRDPALQWLVEQIMLIGQPEA